MAAGKDLYGDLERIEARSKRKRQAGFSSKFFSMFSKDDDDVEDEDEKE